MSQQNQKGEYTNSPPAYGAPYPQQASAPYLQQGGVPYPPAGGAPYPPSEGAPYPPSGGAPYPPAVGGPYPPAGWAPYPPAGGAPYPPAGGAPYSPAGRAPYPPAGGAPYPQSTRPVPGTQVLVVPAMRFGETPVSMKCQYCNADILTGIQFVTGMATWLFSGFLCLMGCSLGCCLIPFCVNACKDVDHKCPNCQRLVGKMKRFDPEAGQSYRQTRHRRAAGTLGRQRAARPF